MFSEEGFNEAGDMYGVGLKAKMPQFQYDQKITDINECPIRYSKIYWNPKNTIPEWLPPEKVGKWEHRIDILSMSGQQFNMAWVQDSGKPDPRLYIPMMRTLMVKAME